jgi:hypothetical protein
VQLDLPLVEALRQLRDRCSSPQRRLLPLLRLALTVA